MLVVLYLGKIDTRPYRHTSVRHRLKQIGALDIFQLNIYQILIFMFKIKNGTSPVLFHDQFVEINHKYETFTAFLSNSKSTLKPDPHCASKRD